MTILNANYRISIGQFGLRVIEITGRCTASERSSIEGGCTARFQLEPLPNMAGAVLKSLDGTTPTICSITPPTFSGGTIQCVKIEGFINPFAPAQEGGTYVGQTILSFVERYQEVGSVA
jgi:hypothetical protein